MDQLAMLAMGGGRGMEQESAEKGKLQALLSSPSTGLLPVVQTNKQTNSMV
jgi:hypothetical protein